MQQDNRHHRRSIRLPAFDYAGPGAYFVTLVTEYRACIFGTITNDSMALSPQGIIADACWRAIPEHFAHVELGGYVVMPNHIHGIILLSERETAKPSHVGATHWVAPTSGERLPTRPTGPARGSLGAILGAYKMAVTRQIVAQFGGVSRIWQRNYYEHVIRDDEDWNRIQRYIAENVANWSRDEENAGARDSAI